MTADALSFLKDLIRFESLSGEEGPIADFVEAHVREAGLPVGRHDDNVYFWLGDGPDRLLLNSHLDVVPPSEEHPYSPFEPVETDGQLYGRGSVDAKASGAAMTTALLALAEEGWTPPGGQVLVALTACEETDGAYNGLEDLRPHLPALSAALVGEPTRLKPCVAQKGLLILKVHVHGRSAHAARAHLGENAILRAADALRTLDALALDLDCEDPFLGKLTLTPTTIEGGTARNVVPDRCTIALDIRSTPAYTHDELTALVAEALNGYAEVEVHSDRIVPTRTPLSARIVQACQKALPGAEPFGSATASDWMFLSDLPVVKIGPGRSTRSHTAEEHIAVAEVRRAVGVYKDIIRNYYALS